MTLGQSKITAQGQISVPANVRKRLGVGPGAVLEWDDRGGDVVVRRAGKSTLADLHKAAFPGGAPKKRSLNDLKKGPAQYVKARHARD
jgi:AbrB family looped-hinge helix DNA binding protein